MPIAIDIENTSRRETFCGITDAVMNFMQFAGQSVCKMNADQACLYTGLQLEELAEKIEVIMGGCVTQVRRDMLRQHHRALVAASEDFKAGLHTGDILRSNHADLIDADIDLAWVSLGALASTSKHPFGAIAHCTYTNLDKLRGGKCIRDANGKIQKPADWQAPDFTPYVDNSSRG